jgi:hypothetical protein
VYIKLYKPVNWEVSSKSFLFTVCPYSSSQEFVAKNPLLDQYYELIATCYSNELPTHLMIAMSFS